MRGQKRRALRYSLLVAVVILVCAGVVVRHTPSSPIEATAVPPVAVEQPRIIATSSGETTAGTWSGLSTPMAAPAYAALVETVPMFAPVSQAPPAGPQQLRLGITTTMPIGVATFASTEIAGAAGEWRVRPWWRPAWVPESVDCGQTGTAVIAGHVAWYTQPGPFADLATLTEGDVVACQDKAGRWHQYRVTQRWRTAYHDTTSYWLPPQPDEGEAILSLYTCTHEVTGIAVVRAVLITERGLSDD